jgi:TolB protein
MSNSELGSAMYLKLLLLLVISLSLKAKEISFDNTKSAAEQTAESAQKALAKEKEGMLSTVNAKVRVEGATFRPFKLFLKDVTGPKGKIGEAAKLTEQVWRVIENDLAISGGVTLDKNAILDPKNEALLKAKGVEGRSLITFEVSNTEIKASIDNKNLITGQQSRSSFRGKKGDTRILAHHLAKNIFEKYVGPEDLFLLEIAAVKNTKQGAQIVLMDFDGYNERPLTAGNWLKTSPSFSPDGKSILYTVITPRGHAITEQVIGSKNVKFLMRNAGLNIDPRIFPDESGMLATLSFGVQPNIYLASRGGEIKAKLTESLGMNLSPSISSDGKRMAFVSTRSGTPQIYMQELNVTDAKKAVAKRITFQGQYNQTPAISPDGKLVAFTGRDEKRVFDIFVVEPDSTRVSRITQNQGSNMEPSFTPSVRYVYFSSNERTSHANHEIYLATLNGAHQVRITTTGGFITPIVRPRAGARSYMSEARSPRSVASPQASPLQAINSPTTAASRGG